MIEVRNMTTDDEYFVSVCSHINEFTEQDESGKRRLAHLKRFKDDGLRVKVALIDGRQVGTIYLLPIEHMPWGITGNNLHCFPCIWVIQDAWKQGAGSALLKAAEDELRESGSNGLATVGYYSDFWFMAANWFEKRGYECVGRRGNEGILVKKFADSVEQPKFLEPEFKYQPVAGKVVIDLFYMTFCQTSEIEAQRVREVAAEFGDRVHLIEHCSDECEVRMKYQIPRAIFIDGKEIGWGYEAPKEGVREAINKALEALN